MVARFFVLLALVSTLTAAARAADYTELSADDRSSGDFYRVRIKVETPLPVNLEVAESIARSVVAQRTARRGVHVIEIVIHKAGEIAPERPAAYVLWAKRGDPLKHDGQPPGDYSQHTYVVRLGEEAAEALAMQSGDLDGVAPTPTPVAGGPAPALVPMLPPIAGSAASAKEFPPDARQAMAMAAATTLLSRWLTAWESRKLDAYLGFYASEFRSGDMDLAAWRERKVKAFQQSGPLTIRATAIEVRADSDGERALVKFIQDYRSQALSDRGRKTLVIRRAGDDFKIVGEDWTALP